MNKRSSHVNSQHSKAFTETLALENKYCAKNYAPLPVVLVRGEGIYVWDQEDKKYIDMMSAYSAVSHGHQHPRLLKALHKQSTTLCVVSRAYYTDNLGPFLKLACDLTNMDRALPMNTGVEAVETALKAARKWAYEVKGVTPDKAEIISCAGNFHGRTISIVAFSSEPQYRYGFGPYSTGFKQIPYADSDALEQAITANTAAFLVEPIQGEGGIIIPPEGYLRRCAEICKKHNVLLICDEVQTGLGRTGKFLASQYDHVQPDGLILGKALGGGILPVSLFLARQDVMDVFSPGDHGSTFGGNPLACAVAHEALQVLLDEDLVQKSRELGDYFQQQLADIQSPLIKEVRGRGLLIGVEFHAHKIKAREVCEKLLQYGILSKETHDTVARFAPPLIINRQQIDQAIEKIRKTIHSLE
ncbi:MAG: ornithine--oxo-acid transaminase [Thiohalomonadales bacterium]